STLATRHAIRAPLSLPAALPIFVRLPPSPQLVISGGGPAEAEPLHVQALFQRIDNEAGPVDDGGQLPHLRRQGEADRFQPHPAVVVGVQAFGVTVRRGHLRREVLHGLGGHRNTTTLRSTGPRWRPDSNRRQ